MNIEHVKLPRLSTFTNPLSSNLDHTSNTKWSLDSLRWWWQWWQWRQESRPNEAHQLRRLEGAHHHLWGKWISLDCNRHKKMIKLTPLLCRLCWRRRRSSWEVSLTSLTAVASPYLTSPSGVQLRFANQSFDKILEILFWNFQVGRVFGICEKNLPMRHRDINLLMLPFPM